jgi:hypothetical protein
MSIRVEPNNLTPTFLTVAPNMLVSLYLCRRSATAGTLTDSSPVKFRLSKMGYRLTNVTRLDWTLAVTHQYRNSTRHNGPDLQRLSKSDTIRLAWTGLELVSVTAACGTKAEYQPTVLRFMHPSLVLRPSCVPEKSGRKSKRALL